MIYQNSQRHPAVYTLCFWVILIFSFIISGSKIYAASSAGGITLVSDLSKVASLARERELVILIEFASDYCEYCRLLENEFLNPMQIDQDYRLKVIIRSVLLDGAHLFKGFQGELISASELADRYDIEVTPTMVFLDAAGNELSDKLVGIWSIDFFGSYIDKRIDTARRKAF